MIRQQDISQAQSQLIAETERQADAQLTEHRITPRLALRAGYDYLPAVQHGQQPQQVVQVLRKAPLTVQPQFDSRVIA